MSPKMSTEEMAKVGAGGWYLLDVASEAVCLLVVREALQVRLRRIHQPMDIIDPYTPAPH